MDLKEFVDYANEIIEMLKFPQYANMSFEEFTSKIDYDKLIQMYIERQDGDDAIVEALHDYVLLYIRN